MALHTHTLSPTDTIFRDSPAQAASARPGFFTRVLNAMMESRQRQADREIAQYLRLSGGRLTDHAEREIERLILSGTRV